MSCSSVLLLPIWTQWVTRNLDVWIDCWTSRMTCSGAGFRVGMFRSKRIWPNLSKGFEQAVELEIAAKNTQRCIVLLTHATAVLPAFCLPVLHASSLLLLVVISLIFHFRQLARGPWRGLLLRSQGSLTLLDRSAQAHPAELLACTLLTANVSILVIRVGGQELNLPVFRWCQSEAYRQLRRFLLKYPPAKATTISGMEDTSSGSISCRHGAGVPNGHRRGSGSVF
jgi:hypothetical protein